MYAYSNPCPASGLPAPPPRKGVGGTRAEPLLYTCTTTLARKGHPKNLKNERCSCPHALGEKCMVFMFLQAGKRCPVLCPSFVPITCCYFSPPHGTWLINFHQVRWYVISERVDLGIDEVPETYGTYSECDETVQVAFGAPGTDFRRGTLYIHISQTLHVWNLMEYLPMTPSQSPRVLVPSNLRLPLRHTIETLGLSPCLPQMMLPWIFLSPNCLAGYVSSLQRTGLEAIALRFEAIALRWEAIPLRLEAIAVSLRLEAIAIRSETDGFKLIVFSSANLAHAPGAAASRHRYWHSMLDLSCQRSIHETTALYVS